MHFSLSISFLLSFLLLISLFIIKSINDEKQITKVLMELILIIFAIAILGWGLIVFMLTRDYWVQGATTRASIETLSFIPSVILFIKCRQNIRQIAIKQKNMHEDLLDDEIINNDLNT